MATEVKHGLDPSWDAKVSGEFWCLVEGHYTDQPNLGAAGVREYLFQSNRPVKRTAELLVLRTAFLDWFVGLHRELTGLPQEDALAQIQNFIDVYRSRLVK